MHRFYLPPEACQQDEITLDDREAHHALHVLRLKPGTPLQVLDGQGGCHSGKVTHCERRSLVIAFEDHRQVPRPATACRLMIGLLKPKAMDWVIQKATELGVTSIVPLQTEHAVARPDDPDRKRTKWQATAIEALKQSGNPWLPDLVNPVTVRQWLDQQPLAPLEIVASLRTGQSLHTVLNTFVQQTPEPPAEAGLWIGPEGDWSKEEETALVESGIKPAQLGPHVLRAETAAVMGISVFRYQWSDDHSPPRDCTRT